MTELSDREVDGTLEIACPSCGSAIDASDHGAEIACTVCNGSFLLAGHLCPACTTYHDSEQAACSACGNALVRLCRQCQTTNWTGDDICVECGAAIDMLSLLEAQSGQGTSDRLSQQMSDARHLNESESLASDRRMAELLAIEEARQAELRKLRVRHTRQERKMLIVVFAAVLVFLLLLVGFAVFSTLG